VQLSTVEFEKRKSICAKVAFAIQNQRISDISETKLSRALQNVYKLVYEQSVDTRLVTNLVSGEVYMPISVQRGGHLDTGA